MRYGIISDIHANYEALTAVLRFLADQSIDKYLCLGDIVGYGAEPRECLEEVRRLGCDFIAGNHDFAAVGKLSIDYFNIFAKESTLWTQEHVTKEDKDFLGAQPLVLDYGTFTLVHGSLYMPEAFGYVQTIIDALYSFRELKNQVLFIGHSHVPITFVEHTSISFSVDETIRLEQGKRYIINVGSTGQPRDEDPRAACAIFDTDQKIVRICRVEYDIFGTAEKIIKAGLPVINAERLKIGR
jgi:predicted phosphodiesterase